jgi:hypothetical protein
MKVATRGFYVAMRFGRSARAFMTAVPRVLQFLLDGQRYLASISLANDSSLS